MSLSTPISASETGGRVLELGCGNGRILLELDPPQHRRRRRRHLAQDASGASAQGAARRGLAPRACRMDARKLAFTRELRHRSLPVLAGHLHGAPDDLERMLSERAAERCCADGLLVVDAFIPRDTVGRQRLPARLPPPARRRAAGAIQAGGAKLTPRINRIERRYEVIATDGEVLEALETSEDIRDSSPEELTDALLRSGFAQQRVWWDYGRASRDTIRNSLPSPRDRHLTLDLAGAVAPSAARRRCEGVHRSRSSASRTDRGTACVKLAELGQIVDDDVHVLGMLRQIVLVVSPPPDRTR